MRRPVRSWLRHCNPAGEAFSRQWEIEIVLWPRFVRELTRLWTALVPCIMDGKGHLQMMR